MQSSLCTLEILCSLTHWKAMTKTDHMVRISHIDCPKMHTFVETQGGQHTQVQTLWCENIFMIVCGLGWVLVLGSPLRTVSSAERPL